MSAVAKIDDPPPGRLLHRLALLAVCLVWPLIWVGGLVTTYDAGMAVPDWPNTYGYNLFLYPYKTWLLGPFDLFIEHGHRLLGAVVGLVAIGILVTAYRSDPRRWVTFLAIGMLIGVIGQGVLGGMRVVLGDRTLAMVHGCVGPAFFAVCVVMAAVTSRHWWLRSSGAGESHDGDDFGSPRFEIGKGHLALGFALVCVSYAQLVLGAQLRHVQPTMLPGGFAMTVALHVMTAFLLWVLTLIVWWRLRRCGDLTLSRPAAWLIGLLTVQILLGTGTWIVNYGWPSLLSWVPGSAGFLLRAKGFADSIIVTAHVATGALILGVSALVLVRLFGARSRSERTDSAIKDVTITPQSATV
jgi:cytochrome c oxidase assembly protein subunit 15